MKLLASENGYVHICGHRGHSIATPENTLAAFRAAKEHGATTCEIDIVLTKDGDIAVLHDPAVDRTTNGSGLVANFTMEELMGLDASNSFSEGFTGERIPSLHQVLEYAKGHLGLVIEIKERLGIDRLIARLGELLEETDTYDDVIIISFDHPSLLEVKRRLPGIRTEGITHARHADMIAVARSAELDSLSIEMARFHPDDAEALHDAGVAIRCHMQRPRLLEHYEALGLDISGQVGSWLQGGLIDSLSGDDVSWLQQFVSRNPLA